MEQIQTFVFFDTEATGLLGFSNPPNITEMAFVACSREHLLEATKGKIPRVISKLLLPVNPCKNIHPESTNITGLDNFMLDKTKKLDTNTANLIKCFLNQLNAPVCLVAHNGFNFDYPILKRQLQKMNCALDANLLCADSLIIFKKIDEIAALDEFKNTDMQAVQSRNEKTPSKPTSFASISRSPYEKPNSARRLFASPSGSSNAKNDSNGSTFNSQSPARISYKLPEIYKRLNEKTPDVTHNAEADTIILLLCAIAMKDDFVKVADSTAVPFQEIAIKF